MAPELAPSIVVLDLSAEGNGALVGSLAYVEPTKAGQRIRVRWSVGTQPMDFEPIGGGVAYIYKTPKVVQIPISDDARPTPIGPSRYRWTEGLQHNQPWLMFIMILPAGYSLEQPDPRPTDTKNFNGRLALYWILEGDATKHTTVEWNQQEFVGSLDTEILRFNRANLAKKAVGQSTVAVEDASHAKTTQVVPSWFPMAGVAFAGVTVLFLMALIVASLFKIEIPASSRFIVAALLALVMALTVSFIGGEAAANGRIPIPFVKESPISFAASGGIAVFIIVLALVAFLYLH